MCSHAHVNKWIMVHFQPRTHIQWLIHSIASPYCQHSAYRKLCLQKWELKSGTDLSQNAPNCICHSHNHIIKRAIILYQLSWIINHQNPYAVHITEQTGTDVKTSNDDDDDDKSGKITKVLVIRIILVIVLFSFCWIILVII